MPGPYFQMQKSNKTGVLSHFTKHHKSSHTSHTVLGKKDATTGQAGEVTAEDIQNDSEYLQVACCLSSHFNTNSSS